MALVAAVAFLDVVVNEYPPHDEHFYGGDDAWMGF